MQFAVAACKWAAFIMKSHRPSRLFLGAALLVLLAATPAFARGFGQKNAQQNRAAAGATQRAEARSETRSAQPAPAMRAAPPPNAPQREPHLEQWMESHKNLSPAEQERALQQLPGFNELPSQTQQRYRNYLTRLNNMTPQQRKNMLNGVEGLERSPRSSNNSGTTPSNKRTLCRPSAEP